MSATGEASEIAEGDIVEGSEAPPALDPSLTCFILLAKFLGTPADPAQMTHDRGRGNEPWGVEDFARISKRLGLIAKIRTARLDELVKLPLPALAETRLQGSVILLKIEDASVRKSIIALATALSKANAAAENGERAENAPELRI